MAMIVLDVGETFSHRHQDGNQTVCVDGRVEVTFLKVRETLGPGDAIAVPGGVEHCLRNLANGPSAVRCAHSPLPPEPN